MYLFISALDYVCDITSCHCGSPAMTDSNLELYMETNPFLCQSLFVRVFYHSNRSRQHKQIFKDIRKDTGRFFFLKALLIASMCAPFHEKMYYLWVIHIILKLVLTMLLEMYVKALIQDIQHQY